MLSCAAGSLQLCPFHLSRGLNGPGHVKAHTTVPFLWLMFSEHDPLFPSVNMTRYSPLSQGREITWKQTP